MFKKNLNHLQTNLFQPENQMARPRMSVLKNHWSGVFYEKVFRMIDESLFAPLYTSQNGRPNFPSNIMAGLEILKELHGLTDEQLYENYLFNYTFHRAFGIENIDDYTFEIRTLYNFRSRLVEYEKESGRNLYLEIFKDGRDAIIDELGIKTGTQRTDSVMISANIKRMNRLMLFHKVMSNLVRDMQRMKIQLSEVYTGLVQEDEDSISYRLPSEKVQETLQEIAERLQHLVLDYRKSVPVSELKSYKDAVRLIEEQCNVNSGKISIRDKNDIDSSSMQNPADTDATYRNKNDEDYRGYSVHATETCDPSNKVQIITNVETVRNNVDDAKVLAEALPVLASETNLERIITDGGFVSDDVRKACEEEDIEFIATAIRGKEQAPDALTSVDFPIDDFGLIATCPAGESPIKRSREADGKLTAHFESAKCNACNMKTRCIAYKSEKHSRLVIDYNRRWIDERKQLIKTEEYLSLCRMRPAVEGLMEKMKPKYLRGRTLFRGLSKVGNRMILRSIGLNMKRYIAHIFNFLKNWVSKMEIYFQKSRFSVREGFLLA